MNRFTNYSLRPLLRRYSRHFEQPLLTIKRYQTGILLGAILCLGILLLFRESEGKDLHQIFKQEGYLDFKNASILGNPSRIILQEEENHLSKTQRSVLESQSQLKKEVETLKATLNEMKASNPSMPHPVASGGPEIPSSLTSQPSVVFGPLPLSSPQVGAIANHVPGDEFTHTRVSDQIKTNAAAPNSPPKRSLGFSELGPIQKDKKPGSSMISFPVKANGKAFLKKPSIVLPSGSYVKASAPKAT